MNSYEAKNIPIENLLSRLGYQPIRKDKGGVEWVYNSPFRKETVPSFFVNVQKNVWNDFGDRGGNILDFVMYYKNVDFRGALEFLSNTYGKVKLKKEDILVHEAKSSIAKQKYEIDGLMPLRSLVLEKYLKGRGVNISIARKYLKVVQFHNTETQAKYFGLGLENISGDFEIRNPNMKTVIGEKNISYLKGKQSGVGETEQSVTVFEGFIDFLSYLTAQNKLVLSTDIIIMNSTKLANRTLEFIQSKDYNKIYTFLDNDKAGNDAAAIISSANIRVVPCNHLYENHKDFNEYWQSHSKTNHR